MTLASASPPGIKADDVRAEILVAHATGIDPKRIMLVGYSEGRIDRPNGCVQGPMIAAVVTLASPGVPGMEVARYQVEKPILKDPKIPAASREQELAKQLAEALKDLSAHESSYLAIAPGLYDSHAHCPALIIQ